MTLPLDFPDGPAADRARVAELLTALLGDRPSEPARIVTLTGNPPRKLRPLAAMRGKRAMLYDHPDNRDAEMETGLRLRKMLGPEPLTGNVALAVIFRRASLQPIDVDNLLKHLLDAGNRIVWADDRQVTATAALVELDRDNPRTVLAVAPYTGGLPRGSDAPTRRLRSKARATPRVLSPREQQDAALIRAARR